MQNRLSAPRVAAREVAATNSMSGTVKMTD